MLALLLKRKSSETGSSHRALRTVARQVRGATCWLFVALTIGEALAATTTQVMNGGSGRLPPVLVSIRQVLNSSVPLAGDGSPVRVKGLVTCYRPDSLLFVQDETAGIFVYCLTNPPSLRAGQYVEIVGRARPGRYSPIIASESLRQLESGPPVTPRQASLAQVAFGGLDAQWVEVRGVIRRQETKGIEVTLELVDSPERLTVWVLGQDHLEDRAWTGSTVHVSGVVAAKFNEQGKLAGFQLIANTPSNIEVLQPGVADYSRTPLCEIKDLKGPLGRIDSPGIARVQGVVTLAWRQRRIFIQDATGSVEVQTEQPVQLEAGARVQAVGFLGPVLEPVVLQDARVTLVGTNLPPRPFRVDSAELFDRANEDRLVEVEAEWLGEARWLTNDFALSLRVGHRLVTGLLETSPSLHETSALKPGTRMRISGVWKNHRVPQLLLRSPLELQVLELPRCPRKPLPLRIPLVV